MALVMIMYLIYACIFVGCAILLYWIIKVAVKRGILELHDEIHRKN